MTDDELEGQLRAHYRTIDPARAPDGLGPRIEDAMDRLGLEAAYDAAMRAAVRRDELGRRDRLAFFALDLHDGPAARTKIYVAQQRAFVRAANAGLEKTLRDRGMIVNTVDVDSFRKRLMGANFYRDWRRSTGEKAWALMEAEVGKVG